MKRVRVVNSLDMSSAPCNEFCCSRPCERHNLIDANLARVWAIDLEGIHNITFLDISRNTIQNVGASHLAVMLRKNWALRDIRLNYCAIEADGAADLASSLKRNSTLTCLSLADNPTGDEAASAFAKMLVRNSSLCHLNLKENSFEQGTKIIGKALANNWTLQSLNLSFNELTDEAIISFEKLSTSLTYLNLNACYVSDEATAAMLITSSLEKNSSLTSLRLRGWSGELVGTISEHKNLKVLELGSAAIREMPKLIISLGHLKVLDIAVCQIGPEGCRILSEALYDNYTLTKLDIAKNEIGTDGATALAGALSHNSCLTWLMLDSNHLEIEGSNAIVESLERNTTITTLNLSRNRVESDRIAAMITKNSTLQELYLDRTGLETAKSIAEALLKNTTIKRVNLSANELYDDGTEMFEEVLKGHPNLEVYPSTNELVILTKDTISKEKTVSQWWRLLTKAGPRQFL
eukprot:TRINITY_DN8607_c1_g3_i1.p1 TRINITY_DN8607_c1_g3~~TRINITY_DN8607_c1_g3_i1.p1  ORF type:complete len:464 (-),score=31.24 TRINITY_DN8607_c1_g3_i1:82-1473(-)